MIATTLDPSFLQSIILISGFKPNPMLSAQAALLRIGLNCPAFTAADLPTEITNGSGHLAGAATGSLIAQGLITVIGRVKSPRKTAKGRRLDLLTLAPEKRKTAETWLARNGY